MFDKERIEQLRKENYLLFGFPGVIMGFFILFITGGMGSSWIGGTPNAEFTAMWVMGFILLPIGYCVNEIHQLLFGRFHWKGLPKRDILLFVIFYAAFSVVSFMEVNSTSAYFSNGSVVMAVYAILIFIQSRGKRWGYVFIVIAMLLMNLIPYIELVEEGQNITEMTDLSFSAMVVTAIISGFFDHFWMLRTLRNEQVGEVSGETA